MIKTRTFITDKELCSVLLISRITLWKILNGFTRGKTSAGTRINITKLHPRVIGGYRRWPSNEVAKELGITVDKLFANLS